jgi:hypothetical protein
MTRGDDQMNSDSSLAAWLIADGARVPHPTAARDDAHRRALAAFRCADEKPSLTTRFAAAITGFRAPPRELPLCCAV